MPSHEKSDEIVFVWCGNILLKSTNGYFHTKVAEEGKLKTFNASVYWLLPSARLDNLALTRVRELISSFTAPLEVMLKMAR